MLTVVRILAVLTAAFQILVGVAALLAPTVAADAFALPPDLPAAVVALIRMFGGLLAGTGLLVARVSLPSPPPFRTVLAAALLLNVATDGLVLATGAMTFGQVGAGMVLEALLGVALLATGGSSGAMNGRVAGR